MNYQISSSQQNFHSIITNEQLEQVVEAISDGRYSWACVLILRFVGYNPLHFIPQRTYSRLMRDHKHITTAKIDSQAPQPATEHPSKNSSDSSEENQSLNQLNNLNDSEISDKKPTSHPGSNVPFYLKTKISSLYSSNFQGLQN